MENIWQFLIYFNTYLAYDPVIVLLDIYPNKMKTYVHLKSVYKCL